MMFHPHVGSAIIILIVSFFLYFVGRAIYIYKKRAYTSISLKKELLYLVTFLYFVAIMALVIRPDWISFEFHVQYGTVHNIRNISIMLPEGNVNIVPLRTLFTYFFSSNDAVNVWEAVVWTNMFANIILFLPFGFIIAIYRKNKYTFRKVVFVCFAFSFLIEILQIITGRSANIDDVLVNGTSALFGYWLYRKYRSKFIKCKMIEHKD